MKILSLILILSVQPITSKQSIFKPSLLSQLENCYELAPPKYWEKDYHILWKNQRFEGVIGNDNQRIQMRVLSVEKDASQKGIYKIRGKSKVKNNICNFEGQLDIVQILLLDKGNIDCENPEMSEGILSGKYLLCEDSTQNHVGCFEGEFTTLFDEVNSKVKSFKGWYDVQGVNDFIGSWTSYGKQQNKYCSWGYLLPPNKGNILYKSYDNEVYAFNSLFLDKGWKSYVISHLNTLFVIPKNFKQLEYTDFIDYSREEIEKYRKLEAEF